MSTSPLAIVKKALQAYADKDRAAIESVIADDYHFTSPIDNRLDRKTYFEICWPNSATTDRVDFAHGFQDGDRAVILYELTSGQKRFRNCEMHIVRDGKLVSSEVFFGWDVPHRVPQGQHTDNDGAGHV
jgi:ketosteroid isomerase-like protein